MAEQYLNNISIDGGPPGLAYGGYIFSAKAETGFTTSPSKCTIRILLANSPNINNPPMPSLKTPVRLTVNGYDFNSYLLESTVEKTVGETIYNLVFCDRSIILDQHAIGLYKRAARVNGRFGNLHVLGEEVAPKKTETKKACLDCNENVVYPTDDKETVQSNCESRDVYYTSADLAGVISNIGAGRPNIPGRNLSNVGSVREVLNAACSAGGCTWYWDWARDTVEVTRTGASVPNINLSDPSITSYSKTLSKEGTFVTGSNDYSIVSDGAASLSTENYTQVVLRYVGPELDQDAVCGLMAQISKELRDDYAYGTGQLYRLGFVGTRFGGMGFDTVDNSVIANAADLLGDGALYDLSTTYDRWRIAMVDPELQSYWEAREAGAIQSYGKRYKASGNLPRSEQTKICRPGEYSKDTSYERYPDFDDAGNWEKNTGIINPNKTVYTGRYPAVVVPLIGALRDAVYSLMPISPYRLGGGSRTNRSPITNTNAFSFISQRQNSTDAALSLIGWKGAPYGNYFGQLGSDPHPDEELKKDVNTGSQGDCAVDPCGNTSDPCSEIAAGCSNRGRGIYQGIADNRGISYGGIILPSTANFFGWFKKSVSVNRVIKGKTIIKDGELPNEDVREVRYSSNDVSKDGGYENNDDYQNQVAGVYSLASSLSVEYAGIVQVPIVGGLTSFSYIIDSNGAFTSVNYASRPDEPPQPDPVLGKVVVKKLGF